MKEIAQAYLLNYLEPIVNTLESILDCSPIKGFEFECIRPMTKPTTLQLKEERFGCIEHYIVLSTFCGPDAVLCAENSSAEK